MAKARSPNSVRRPQGARAASGQEEARPVLARRMPWSTSAMSWLVDFICSLCALRARLLSTPMASAEATSFLDLHPKELAQRKPPASLTFSRASPHPPGPSRARGTRPPEANATPLTAHRTLSRRRREGEARRGCNEQGRPRAAAEQKQGKAHGGKVSGTGQGSRATFAARACPRQSAPKPARCSCPSRLGPAAPACRRARARSSRADSISAPVCACH